MADLELTLSDRDVERLAAQVADLVASRLAPPAPASSAREVMTTAQAAAYLGYSPQQLELLRKQGGGPRYAKPSRRIVRYRRADLDEFIAASLRRHTSEDGARRRAGAKP
jgi:hypothetical protein